MLFLFLEFFKIIKSNSNFKLINLNLKKYTKTMPHYPREIEYSDKYADDFYEYRHVILPKTVYQKMPRGRILSEMEWRGIGV